MDAKSNPQVIPKTLAELIAQETSKENLDKPINYYNYKVYPEDDGYDTPKNPFAPV